MYYNMNDIDIKSSNNLLRKVFLYMILGIAISFGTGIYLYQFNQELLFSLSRYFNILFIGSIGIVLVSDFMLKKLSASILRILFLLYSLIIGTVFSTIGFLYSPLAILYAFGTALTIFVVMAIYGFISKEDLSSYRAFFIVGLISLIIMGFINMYLGVGPLYWIETIAGIVIFTGLIAYDVNRIKWQSYQLADGDNEAMEKMSIDGAFSLYLDFINLFFYLLRIFGRKK
ncbi:Bax inhibitor-1/YccA family protein [Fusobacterium polymorphum]|uniref:Bax inhibitor-1/YccA family protein n=1 Tax=Fusobacterium nucleatum subsp. polymorphum TaxID=76857 RepID=UPI002B4BDE3D|nr:Bax inhibitor-1/YccA family protein [Fusobacterium polymorphum]WRL76271.1 Bax inhibitor-1/YccA family protein [Fusobacterium polymorphum]